MAKRAARPLSKRKAAKSEKPAALDLAAAMERGRAKAGAKRATAKPAKPSPARPPTPPPKKPRRSRAPHAPAGAIDAIVDDPELAEPDLAQRAARIRKRFKVDDPAYPNARQPLTPKQRRFIRQYMVDHNAGASARRAGYSINCADQIGYENLRKPEIAEAIAELMEGERERLGVTRERVLDAYAEIAFTSFADFAEVDANGDIRLNFKKATRSQLAALREVKTEVYTEGKGEEAEAVKSVTVKLADRAAALRDLGKFVGLFKGEEEGAAEKVWEALAGAVERAKTRGGRK